MVRATPKTVHGGKTVAASSPAVRAVASRRVEHVPDQNPTPTLMTMPAHLASLRASELTRDQLLEILEAVGHDGIRIAFAGKSNSRRLARAVRPRVAKTLAAFAYGDENARASNTLRRARVRTRAASRSGPLSRAVSLTSRIATRSTMH